MSSRLYPERPILAVSAAILREGRLLVVRRAQPPMQNLFTFPGGVVETGETLFEAVRREISEETGIAIAPVALAGHREILSRDAEQRVSRHFVVLCFASRWLSGEFAANEELAEGRWIAPQALCDLTTTDGLAEIAAEAVCLLSGTR